MSEPSSSEIKQRHQSDRISREFPLSSIPPEVVGVLPNPDELEAAVEDLLVSGFDRRQISVLAHSRNGRNLADTAAGRISLAELEDDPEAPIGAYLSLHSRAELNAAAVGLPMYAAAIGAYTVIVATGGSLAFAIAALLIAGAAGAGLGGLIAHTIGRHHREAIAAQIARGGLLVWVQVTSAEQENQAIQILTGHGGRHVHVHHVDRAWGIDDVPFHDAQPDPFLERGPGSQFDSSRGVT